MQKWSKSFLIIIDYYIYIYIYIYIYKIGGPELVKRQVFPSHFDGSLFQGNQVVNSTDLCDIKYIFKLDDVIL